MRARSPVTLLSFVLFSSFSGPAQPSPVGTAVVASTVWITMQDGGSFAGAMNTDTLRFVVDGEARDVPLEKLLSFHSGAPASAHEQGIIETSLPLLDDPATADVATAALVDIGLPVLTPLLRSYPAVDGHLPDARYRLFQRVMPGHADGRDRELDLIRLADGEVLRGRWAPADLELVDGDGVVHEVTAATLRRLAVRQPVVRRHFDLHAMRHCTYVGWLDTGVSATASSKVRADARGYVRLSFDLDGWATGPDGLFETLPGKRKLQEGFRWGAVLYRVGAAGERRYAGSHLEQAGLGSGSLWFVVNDNEHWQNNIGSYRLQVEVTNAFDLGEPQ